MSILNLQKMEPVAVESAVAILSTTSSGSSCCTTSPKKPSL
ncbi:class III lanthipeptide [Streptomyces sp. NPDC021020]